jgi:hypothetical protein
MVILNPEGGGTIAGQYNGKHSPEFRHGILNGGNFSRWICNDLQRELDYETLHYTNICPELSNVSECTRVQRLNSYTMAYDTFALSIYTGTHERSGIRILGNIREGSEEIGELLHEEMCINMEGWQMPVEKVCYDLEHEHAILKKPKCPSFVIYAGSVDLYYDYSRMINLQFQESLVGALFNTIKTICQKSGQD